MTIVFAFSAGQDSAFEFLALEASALSACRCGWWKATSAIAWLMLTDVHSRDTASGPTHLTAASLKVLLHIALLSYPVALLSYAMHAMLCYDMPFEATYMPACQVPLADNFRRDASWLHRDSPLRSVSVSVPDYACENSSGLVRFQTIDLLCLSAGAAAISGKVLYRIEVHGKQLFYFFGEASTAVVMQIHFGMSGAFRTMTLTNPREARETTRLVLENLEEGLLAHLSAMTVQYGDTGNAHHPLLPEGMHSIHRPV